VWAHAFSKVGREAPVRTEPLPTTLSVALCLEQSFLVVVVVLVLVLDLLWGVNRSARMTRTARFGRSLSLPRLNQRGLPAGPYGSSDSAVSPSEGELHPQALIRIFAGFGW
jgi:hypothetical protein